MRSSLPGRAWRANFLCNLGHGDPEKLHQRSPRLDFDDACQLLCRFTAMDRFGDSIRLLGSGRLAAIMSALGCI